MEPIEYEGAKKLNSEPTGRRLLSKIAPVLCGKLFPRQYALPFTARTDAGSKPTCSRSALGPAGHQPGCISIRRSSNLPSLIRFGLFCFMSRP